MAMDFNPILKFGWAIAQLIALCIVLLSIAPLYDCVAADNRSVKALLGEARAAAEKVTSEHIRWDLLLEIESIAIVSGDQDLARSNLREMTQDAIKRENHLYLERIALAYVEAGDMSAASEIWASFSQEMADNLLVGTTRTLAENENLDGAFKTAEFVKRGVYKSTALAYVGVGEPQAGNVAEALRIREMIRSISSKEWTSEISILASVALHQAKSDRNKAEETLAAALELAMELPRTTLLDVPRIRALNIVASTWAKIGSEEGTLKTISRIGGDPEAAERATLEAALAAAKAGKTSVSRNLLARIPEEGEEDRYVGFTAQIVSTFVALGDLENAFEAIPRLADDCDILAEAVGEIALAQAASGDYESALATIRTVGTFAEPSIVSGRFSLARLSKSSYFIILMNLSLFLS